MNSSQEIDLSQWKNIWTLAEVKNNRLRPVSYELLGRGRGLADQRGCLLCTVVIGNQVNRTDIQELIERGADQVFIAEDPMLQSFLVEPHARVLRYLIEQYHPEVVIAAATTTGRTIMPYLSAQIHTGLTADCTELSIDPDTNCLLQTRPAIGGNIMATIKTPTARPQMATIRPKSTRIPELLPCRKGKIITIENLHALLHSRVVFEQFISDADGAASIADADVIISGGAGVRKTEGFTYLNKLASLLNGAVGASRPCVDHGWQPYSRQIGLSGKTVSPRLYMACGISGAIQHLAGIQTAENIIAINNDPNAPIFQLADLGIVGNMFDILSVVVEKLEKEPL